MQCFVFIICVEELRSTNNKESLNRWLQKSRIGESDRGQECQHAWLIALAETLESPKPLAFSRASRINFTAPATNHEPQQHL